MRLPLLNWWQWLSVGAGCYGLGIVIGPLADRHGYGSYPGLIVSILAETAGTVCFVLGFLRFVKWIWFLIKSSPGQ